MNKNSNLYTILYATVIVIVVAVALAFTSQALKDKQKENENIDRMQQILRAVGLQTTAEETIQKYNQTIVKAYLVNEKGEIVPGSEGADTDSPAFQYNLAALRLADTKQAPVFEANIDGKTNYILGMYGAGLWGPIWGYLGLDQDKNTVVGVDFSHASETPGLGAKIVETPFKSQFVGKKLFGEGEQFTSVAVVKTGTHPEIPGEHRVDAISGSTLTSNGVNTMMTQGLKRYEPFLTNKMN